MLQRFTLADQFADHDLERDLLATLVNNSDVYWDLADFLNPSVFHHPELKIFYQDIVQSIESQQIPTLDLDGQILPEPLEAVKKLANLYQKRLLADVGQDFLDQLRDDLQAIDIVDGLEDRLTDVQQSIKAFQSGQVVSLTHLFPDMLKEIEKRYQAMKDSGRTMAGLPTGIPQLDRLLGGYQTGLHLLAAEPGQGKTTFTLQMASYMAQERLPVIFVSFEETLSRLALKAICQEAGLESKSFADGNHLPEELAKAVNKYGQLFETLYLIEGSARLTVSHLKAKALQIMSRLKQDRCLIIIDYLQRWASCRRDFSDFRHVISSLVSELRELSMRLDSPVLVISSQNRSGQGSASMISLKESGDLEYSADSISFLVADDTRMSVPPARAVNLQVAKNRYGDKGKVEMIFRPDIGRFREVSL